MLCLHMLHHLPNNGAGNLLWLTLLLPLLLLLLLLLPTLSHLFSQVPKDFCGVGPAANARSVGLGLGGGGT
jgi:hypothetical protein